MRQKQFRNAPTFSALQLLAVTIQTGTPQDVADHIAILQASPLFAGRKAYQSMFDKLAAVIRTGMPASPIFKLDGNSKLPFVAFSSAPAVTCPGAGACLDFCYSFRAWRFAAAYLRQAQNTYLLRHASHIVSEAFHQLPADITLRLYVDGDFASPADVAFWFDQLNRRPDVAAYGYSKSFSEILAYRGAWPANYQLNISAGHCHSPAIVAAIKALPITRGEFVAVPVGHKVTGAQWGTRALADKVRKAGAALGRLFVCPGSCGSCTSSGHACGSARFAGIPIAIAMH